jgi:copper chaperone CopZ
MLKSIAFQITGKRRLACKGCEQRVQELLRTLPGVKQVQARALDQRIGVLYEPTIVEPDAIATRLAEAGYEARAVVRVPIWAVGNNR